MASRRTVITRDRQRNCTSRKNTRRKLQEWQGKQAALVAELIRRARDSAATAKQ